MRTYVKVAAMSERSSEWVEKHKHHSGFDPVGTQLPCSLVFVQTPDLDDIAAMLTYDAKGQCGVYIYWIPIGVFTTLADEKKTQF